MSNEERIGTFDVGDTAVDVSRVGHYWRVSCDDRWAESRLLDDALDDLLGPPAYGEGQQERLRVVLAILSTSRLTVTRRT